MKSYDKRVAKRIPFRVPVKFGVNGKCINTGIVIDVSSTGICIKTSNVFAPGTVVNIEILYNSKTLSGSGKVMWAKKVPPNLIYVTKAGMGIHFKEICLDFQNLIQEKNSRTISRC